MKSIVSTLENQGRCSWAKSSKTRLCRPRDAFCTDRRKEHWSGRTSSALVEDFQYVSLFLRRRTADPTVISVGNESMFSSALPSWNGNNVLGDGGEATKRLETVLWPAPL